ncbi:MAG: phage portal protein [Candidatus Competibacter denitrificans]
MRSAPARKPGFRAYEADSSRLEADGWTRIDYGPNAALDLIDRSRARTQDAVRNNPWLRRAIRLLVSHEIGCGIQPIPKTDDEGANREIAALWAEWVSQADADGVSDFYGLQAMKSRARRESGEVFTRLRPRLPSDGLVVSLQVQTLEAAMLPISHNGENGNNRIRQGIEITPFGKRAAYWFYREHPGERTLFGGYSKDGLTRVPADEILHHYTPERPGQLRGTPTPVAALVRARNFDQYESAELTRKKSRAKFVGSITREGNDENPITDEPLKTDTEIARDLEYLEKQRSVVDVDDGYLLNLAPGESFTLAGTDGGEPGVEFLRIQLRAIAAAMGVPYEILTGDYGSTNDRIMRVILNVFYRDLEMEQDRLTFQDSQPIYHRWLDTAVLEGTLKLRGYFDNPRSWRRCEWRAHAWSYVNPLQEVQTYKLMKDEGFKSRTAICAEMNWDAAEVDRQNRADQDRESALGLKYGSQPIQKATP